MVQWLYAFDRIVLGTLESEYYFIGDAANGCGITDARADDGGNGNDDNNGLNGKGARMENNLNGMHRHAQAQLH